MCGICGVVQLGGSPREVVEADRLDAMTDAMTHRGPDDRGIYRAPGIAIGVRRLSIVDVAGGHQPVTNEDSTVVAAQNGELYNHLELARHWSAAGTASRAAATRRSCRTSTSARRAFPELLRGKFAIAVWDERGGGRCSPATGSGSSRSTARDVRRSPRLRLGAEEPARERAGRRRARLRGDRRLPHPRLRPRRRARRSRACRSCCRATGSSSTDGTRRAERYWHYPAPAPDHSLRRRRVRRAAARAARGSRCGYA